MQESAEQGGGTSRSLQKVCVHQGEFGSQEQGRRSIRRDERREKPSAQRPNQTPYEYASRARQGGQEVVVVWIRKQNTWRQHRPQKRRRQEVVPLWRCVYTRQGNLHHHPQDDCCWKVLRKAECGVISCLDLWSKPGGVY